MITKNSKVKAFFVQQLELQRNLKAIIVVDKILDNFFKLLSIAIIFVAGMQYANYQQRDQMLNEMSVQERTSFVQYESDKLRQDAENYQKLNGK